MIVSKLAMEYTDGYDAVSRDAMLQSVFDDLKKELQLRSVANGDLAAEHMETGVLMLGVLRL